MAANPVEVASGNISPYGVRDMAGNVREWTSTISSERPSMAVSMAVVKVGAWVDLSIVARAAHQEYVNRDGLSHILGFRCALDVKIAR